MHTNVGVPGRAAQGAASVGQAEHRQQRLRGDIYIYIYIHTYIYIYREREMYVYVYIYIYREREIGIHTHIHMHMYNVCSHYYHY